jgi:hypothetical protein
MPTERIPFAQPMNNRKANFAKDSRTTNYVFEGSGESREVIKRQGLTKVATLPVSRGQGMYDYADQIIVVTGGNVYSLNPNAGYTPVFHATLTATTYGVYFARTFNEENLFLQNLTDAYIFNRPTGAITNLDPGHGGVSFPPGPFVPGAVFLDNYIFVGTSSDSTSPNRIYNSNLGDPSTWSVGSDYISFEQTGDQLVAITKHLNYLIAFGRRSIQFFYDQGTQVLGVGSPLAVASSYNSEIGCAAPNSIVTTDNTVVWVGTSRVSGASVFYMEGSSAVRISTEFVDKFLDADPLSQVSAYCHRHNGHIFYVLTLTTTQVTLVYDMTMRIWSQWTMFAGGVETYFKPTLYASVLSVGYCLNDTTGEVYYFNENTYTDNGAPIYCRSVTKNSDSGSTKRKFYGRLEIVGDKVAGATMQVRHTGDDYVSWSAWRNLDLNKGRAQMYLSGADRRRAWEFLCISAVALRIDAAEIDFRIGEMDQAQGIGGGAPT